MTHLISNDFVGLVSLVASVLVVLYIVGYGVMLYHQQRRGEIRPDWHISSIFYLGIGILALGYILAITHTAIGGLSFEGMFNAAYLLSLVLFAYGFELRAGTARQLKVQLTKPTGKKRK